MSVFDFGSLKPDVMRGLGHGPLHHPQQPLMRLAHLGGKKHIRYSLKYVTQNKEKQKSEKSIYQWVATVVGQDDDVDGCRVIGHADAAVLWFVLSAGQNRANRMPELCVCRTAGWMSASWARGSDQKAPVVVGDDGRERSGADAVANQVDLLAEEEP